MGETRLDRQQALVKMEHSLRLSLIYPQLLKLAAGSPDVAQKTLQDAHAQAIQARRFGSALKTLQRGLTGERDLAGATYFSQRELLGAYLLYYWPVSFLQTTMALGELESRHALPRLGSVLDLGAGPGPAACAAILAGASDITLLDKSREALDMAAKLIAAMDEKESSRVSTSVVDLESLVKLPTGPFDLIIASHSANELWKLDAQALDKRALLFGKAVELLAEGGLLLFVEPSAVVTSRPALALRNRLLQDFSGSLRCVAPCPGSYSCPILAAGESRSCHSTWAWNPYEPIAALAAAAGLDRDSVKSTWFALKKTGAVPPTPASSIPTSVDATARSVKELSSLEGRIISEAMLNKAGRFRYILCTSSGMASFSAKANDSAAETTSFFSLRRGDMIKASLLEQREGENNFGFIAGSKLDIVMKAADV